MSSASASAAPIVAPDAPVAAFLFDMDGTIMDSHEVWNHVLNELCLQLRGTPITETECKAQFGKSMEEVIQNLFPHATVSEYYSVLETVFERHCHKATMLEGAAEMIAAAVKATNGRVALVTNCPHEQARHLIASYPVMKEAFGEAIFCALDPIPADLTAGLAAAVKAEADAAAAEGKEYDTFKIASKPSGVMLHAAAARLGVDINECVMIGDAINDVRAAVNAGCRCIAINWTPGHTYSEATFNTHSLAEVTTVISETLAPKA